MIEQLFRIRCEGCRMMMAATGLGFLTMHPGDAALFGTFAAARGAALSTGWSLGPVKCPTCRPRTDGPDSTPEKALDQAHELTVQAITVVEHELPSEVQPS